MAQPTTKHVLVVDNDPAFLHQMKSILEKNGYIAHVASSYDQGLKQFKEEKYNLVFADHEMNGFQNQECLDSLAAEIPPVPWIIATANPDIQLAVKAIKLGAKDYLEKPLDPKALLELIRAVTFGEDGAIPKTPAPRFAKKKVNLKFVEGNSPQTRQVNEHVALVGPTNMSVLIQGESGTGKEYVAKRIHDHSKRASQPFVAIDCGALSKDLAASELFGHVKGSFTGATGDHAGRFEAADGGTLFLDEIGNLSYDTQVKLLRAIQEKVIRRVGGREDIPIDVRLITATNENLQEAIRNGAFRKDLYHRINEFKIEISPLRVREEEIPQFARFFLELANEELEKQVENFSPDAIEFFKRYHWPGNLRELKNVVRRSVLLTKGKTVEKAALASEITSFSSGGAYSSGNVHDSTDLKELESNMEKQKIMEALSKVRYNKTKAAKLLNIDRKTLYNKIKNYGLDV